MSDFRRNRITAPLHKWAKKALPSLSETEAEALEAGDVWWEAELFSGNPDWSRLHAVAEPELTEEELAFLEGPCREFCEMIDDWQINRETADLPPEAWDFLREKKFFGMIIDKAHGGLGFSAYAHSEIVRYLSTRSVAAAVTVMVPNSLGPGELLHMFGTDAQKDHWLPRLADGRELPAFGLTSAEAGSDASAMKDEGVVEKGLWNGEEVLGIRLNWAKRYITLAPVCTVLGLAFKLRDPDGHLGGEEDVGITCALVPADLPGVDTGRRHLPSSTMFMNGPTTGKDVFIPLDHIIGGPDYAGRGWMMLMSALAAGRGISLPSMGCAGIALSAHTTGAYSRVREQFNLPIGLFGGIQARLGRLAADAYAMDAARRLTCAGLDAGHALSVISAIMKAHATYRMRDALNDAMDVHSGKAVIDGPSNYLLPLYRAVPIGITVEGANIVTRSLIIFGQGAIRAHPHMLNNIKALQIEDEEESLAAFDRSLWAHVSHTTKTLGRAIGRAWTGGRLAPAPEAGKATPIYRQVSRWAAAYALVADFAFLTLGGALKREELISGRMGDVLSELYILTATLKRWDDEGGQQADLPLVEYTAARAFQRIRIALDEVLRAFPARWAAWLLRVLILPGGSAHGPSDKLTTACADLIYAPSDTRDRIIGRMFDGCTRDGIADLNAAYAAVNDCAPLMKKLRDAGHTPESGLEAGILGQSDRDRIARMQELVDKVIAVEDYSADELAALFPGKAVSGDRQEAAE
ncbi:acyl-CoA dehydrogenase [Cribrihabitans marinus]|uniref:Acyl-coenzyme A dehydrogenase n=1 Tax=Cribrihabitans marinus TaxID=1227549 RepID=A0A1H7D2Y2_9RHOB|nr:acyl-CoA dehydrogenase [Cribrihabitans marinus]GGH37650.1 acyl-CoA dehydrogenase [Cribrihabitans marinus]SEJ96086.1 acyl-CoA dehydrogenase [Cribrihabitans marinus]